MGRNKKNVKTVFGIRLSKAEKRAIEELAKRQKLPPSTMARKVLLDLAASMKGEEENPSGR